MMKTQTTEFILGYLFSEQERRIFKRISNKTTSMFRSPTDPCITKVPLLWFGIKHRLWNHPTFINTMITANDICVKLDSTLSDAFVNYDIHTTVTRDKQYLSFVTVIQQKKRKMTIKEIEDILGFEIELTSWKSTEEMDNPLEGAIE